MLPLGKFERFSPLKQCMNCFGYGHPKLQCKAEKRPFSLNVALALTPTENARAKPSVSIVVIPTENLQTVARPAKRPLKPPMRKSRRKKKKEKSSPSECQPKRWFKLPQMRGSP